VPDGRAAIRAARPSAKHQVSRLRYQDLLWGRRVNTGKMRDLETFESINASKYHESPRTLSTTVLLTRTGPNLILLGIEHCPTHQAGEGLSN
jgi:hypothetical protein